MQEQQLNTITTTKTLRKRRRVQGDEQSLVNANVTSKATRRGGGRPFKQPITITTKLLDELKAGTVTYPAGQWFRSKKWNMRCCKFLGVFQRPDNGIIKPVVKFSYPQKGESAIGWNKRFQLEKQQLELDQVAYLRRYPSINDRQIFVKQQKEDTNILDDQKDVLLLQNSSNVESIREITTINQVVSTQLTKVVSWRSIGNVIASWFKKLV